MKIAILAPIAWRTPPRKYGPWEQVASTLAEGLVARGLDVTLYATADSYTTGKLKYSAPSGYEENRSLDPKVEECLHISHVMESANEFDIIHNHFDFLPLTYSRFIKTPIVTTIHGFSSPKIIPVYKKYNNSCHYVSISDADRSPALDYMATVYNGVNPALFPFVPNADDYLLFFGRIHPEKGAHLAIEVAQRTGRRLIIAGLIQDQEYFTAHVAPHIDDQQIQYVGNVGPDKRAELLGNATVLLHLIGFDEPFGLSVVEAMLCGTPVIAINRGAMPELIVHNETGFLVNDASAAANAIIWLPQLSRKTCREWATNMFSQDSMVEGYMQVYERILSA